MVHSAAVTMVLAALLACAQGKRVVARFGTGGVSGTISFEQSQISQPTTVSINLAGLDNQGGGYHIHMLPVPQSGDCGATGGHFNPFNVPLNQCTPTDQSVCEIGDLSGRFGSLAGQTSLVVTHTGVTGIPLFGPYSVVGRSIVIHKSTTGNPRWVCATIEYATSDYVARADFTDGLRGSVTFRQPYDSGITTADITITYPAATDPATSGHKWHIHTDPISNANCVSAAGHYNPTGICLTETCGYSTLCGQGPLQYGCEVGDMSGKIGTLSIGPPGTTPTFANLVDVPLHGPNSVVGRSIVIHEANGGSARLGCATINMVSKASVPSSSNDGAVVGGILGAVFGLSILVLGFVWYRKFARDAANRYAGNELEEPVLPQQHTMTDYASGDADC